MLDKNPGFNYKLAMNNNIMKKESALSQNMEDYLEAIMLICLKNDVARVKDVAAKLGVRKPSVISALKKLSDLGMITHEHYGYIKLTDKGMQVAQGIYNTHVLIYDFFTTVLGVDAETADHDACMIEHYISHETRERLTKFIDFVKCYPHKDVDAPWLVNFRHFLETGNVRSCECVCKEKSAPAAE